MIVSKGKITAREGMELIKYFEKKGLVLDMVCGCLIDNYIINLGGTFLLMKEVFLTTWSSEYELFEFDDIELANEILN